MHGARRVVMFCLLTAVLPTILLVIPLYLRHSVYSDVTYPVAESDVLEIDDGISTVFCQAHSLKMNSTFHAFQVSGMPELSTNRKHIRLKKSMTLPDDTLEYWGFYLLKGSSVVLSVCSRFEGSRVMVVKGERNLRMCGLLEHEKGPITSHMAPGEAQVRVTFETNAQEIKPPQSSSPLLQKIPTSTEKPDYEEFEGENVSNEDIDMNNITVLEQRAKDYLTRHWIAASFHNESDTMTNTSSLEPRGTRHLRHAKRRLHDFEKRLADLDKAGEDNMQEPKKLKKNLKRRGKHKNRIAIRNSSSTEPPVTGFPGFKNGDLDEAHVRSKRNVQLDGGIEHGGNAANLSYIENEPESSFSSFENNLRTCYEGKILLNEEFPPSQNCSSVLALETHGTMEAVHDVVEDGYYYYIFFSDNDYVSNDIHAIFNIHKTTYQYAKHSNACYNETECTFPISFWSDETVIVEIPTRDGIEHEEDDITYLISSCYPRMSVYVIFPVAVLFLILGCAFM